MIEREEESTIMEEEKTDQTSYTDSISKLTHAIEDSISKVNAIPEFKIGKISDTEIKQQLLPTLEEANYRIADLDAVQRELNAIRNEIISPVKKEIEDTGKSNKRLSVYALTVGIIGAIIGFASPYFNNKYLPTSKQTEKLVQSAPEIRFSKEDWSDFREIVVGETSEPSTILIDANVSGLINEIELKISLNGNLETASFQPSRTKLNALLDGRIRDVELASKVIYGIILCESVQDNWELILRMVEFAETRNLINTSYGSALQVYKAEAYIKMSNSIQRALEIFNQCKSELSSNSLNILSLDQKEVENISDIVSRRIETLELLKSIENLPVVIFDSQKLGRDQPLAERLNSIGFKEVRAKGNWGVQFLYPYIYYREKTLPNSQLFKSVKEHIGHNQVQHLYFEESESDVIKSAFRRNENLAMIIVL